MSRPDSVSVVIASHQAGRLLFDTLAIVRGQAASVGAQLVLGLNCAPGDVESDRERLADSVDELVFEPEPGKSNALKRRDRVLLRLGRGLH